LNALKIESSTEFWTLISETTFVFLWAKDVVVIEKSKKKMVRKMLRFFMEKIYFLM
jgi:hypothetical protein